MHTSRTQCGQLGRNIYPCNLCEYKTIGEEALNTHLEGHNKYKKLCENYPNFNFSLCDNTISWDEYGLNIRNDNQIYLCHDTPDNCDDFENVLEQFFEMWQITGKGLKNDQITDICSSSLWHFETEEVGCDINV